MLFGRSSKADEVTLLRRRITYLEDTIRSQNVRLDGLENELEEALNRVKELEDTVRRVLAPEVKA